MKTRVVTYDVKKGNDYQAFYAYAESVSGKQLTESTYELTTDLDQKDFEAKMKKLFSKDDNVYYVSVSDKNNLYSKKIEL